MLNFQKYFFELNDPGRVKLYFANGEKVEGLIIFKRNTFFITHISEEVLISKI